jgi:hypothetical protein
MSGSPRHSSATHVTVEGDDCSRMIGSGRRTCSLRMNSSWMVVYVTRASRMWLLTICVNMMLFFGVIGMLQGGKKDWLVWASTLGRMTSDTRTYWLGICSYALERDRLLVYLLSVFNHEPQKSARCVCLHEAALVLCGVRRTKRVLYSSLQILYYVF